MTGVVHFGINNIYCVYDKKGICYECRFKGKILDDAEIAYNPLAPGDRVEFSPVDEDKGLITKRIPRRNQFRRWNKKGGVWQVIAANLDQVVVVMSAASPPFRPRFVDRGLICAALDDVPVMVLLNKADLGIKPSIETRLAAWKAAGIDVFCCSIATGDGLSEFKDNLISKTTVLFGPSGVGKSSLINALIPGLELSTSAVSQKHSRGRHKTNFGRLVRSPSMGQLIDTPGVRDVLIRNIEPNELESFFVEIMRHRDTCEFQPCSHRHEPRCAVMAAVECGDIHPDRYQSYVNIRGELEDQNAW